MSTAREEILARIRQAQPQPPATSRTDEYVTMRRQYRQVGQLDAEHRIKLFEERLQDYDAAVWRCPADQISEVVARAMAARGKKSLVAPASVPAAWLPRQFDFLRGDDFSRDQLDVSEGVLTGCAVAIAITGSIILQHQPGWGRRVVTLIPDYHLCVVFASQVVETVPEAIRQFEPASKFPITTISGPSATADIEMSRVKGVHGPRHLDVILAVE